MQQWKGINEEPIPVIAAGGIYSGEDIRKFLNMGASGVQMATRFVTTNECDASPEFKNTYIRSKMEDIEIIDSPVGMPGRAIANKFTDSVKRGEKHPLNCHFHCIRTCDNKTSPYCIAMALINAQRGRLEHGFAFAGKNAYRTNEIVSVRELIKSLIEEYKASFSGTDIKTE
jgi:NAD(P)H-dependent flavin oxidoreductase YrpB (nitropropane dioxygenase family)